MTEPGTNSLEPGEEYDASTGGLKVCSRDIEAAPASQDIIDDKNGFVPEDKSCLSGLCAVIAAGAPVKDDRVKVV